MKGKKNSEAKRIVAVRYLSFVFKLQGVLKAMETGLHQLTQNMAGKEGITRPGRCSKHQISCLTQADACLLGNQVMNSRMSARKAGSVRQGVLHTLCIATFLYA